MTKLEAKALTPAQEAFQMELQVDIVSQINKHKDLTIMQKMATIGVLIGNIVHQIPEERQEEAIDILMQNLQHYRTHAKIMKLS